MDVDPAENQRLQNLLAAVATGLSDAIESAATEVAGLDRVATTALVALLDFSPEGSVRKLALGVGLSHSGTVRLVDRLTEAGLVRQGDRLGSAFDHNRAHRQRQKAGAAD